MKSNVLILSAEILLSIVAWVAISVSTVFWVLCMAVVYAVHPILDPRRKILHSMAGCWGRGLVRMAPGCCVEVSGRENIPSDQPVIFMANHQSYVDVPALYFLRRPFKWTADVALFSIPFFGWGMRMAGYIPVRRGDTRASLKSLKQAQAWLSEGMSIFTFPQGSRSHTGVFGRFHTGGFRLAAQAGVPIVPVVIVGTRRLLPRDSWVFRPGVKLQIQVLPPILSSSVDLKNIRVLAPQLRREMTKLFCQSLKEGSPIE